MPSEFDWIRVWEIFLGASLAFVFGGVLQWRLMARQERFQKHMEDRRDAQEEKLEQRRLAAGRKNTSTQVETQKTIAMNELNAKSLAEARSRSGLP